MSERLISVGLDIGTTSTQMVVSALSIQNRASVFAVPELDEHTTVQVHAHAEHCTYTLSEQAEVALKAELRLEGTVCRCSICEVLTDFEVDEETANPHDHALKLYFGRAGERIWDIARRCRTSVSAIMEENDLTEEILTENGMLLIPIVHQ